MGTGILLSLIASIGNAQTIKIHRNTVITTPTTYENVTLDMSDGSFIIKTNGELKIKRSIINGTLSKDVPILFTIDNGKLNLEKNTVNIITHHLPPHPQTQSLEYVMNITLGGLNIDGNQFNIDNPFTAGLLITTASIPTTDLKFTHNRFERFHGVLYLIASDNSLVADNTFFRNSYGNIVIIGNSGKIIHNSIYFSGNDHLGNSIDVIDSSNITISNNLLFTPTCHGIYIMNSHHLAIEGNNITGGITYAMNILTYPETLEAMDDYVVKLADSAKLPNRQSGDISITNNFMSQNRYGIAASDTVNLSIKGNYFTQRFNDAESRKFWTNNNVLMQNVTNLSWQDNYYKEAYTQAIDGDNSSSSKFVPFPKTGGVVL